jgi:hypothetical protein
MKSSAKVGIVLILILSFLSISCGVGSFLGSEEQPAEVQSTKPIKMPKPSNTSTPLATATLEEIPISSSTGYTIPAGEFSLDSQESCATDVSISDINDKMFTTSGTLSMRNNEFVLWCPGARHTWLGSLSYEGYTFASDDADPLIFTIDNLGNYTYVSGKGQVMHGNEVVNLPQGGVDFSRLLFADGFDDNANQWPIGEVKGAYWNGSRDLEDGTFIWDGVSEMDMYSYVYPDREELLEQVANVQVSTKVRLTEPDMDGYFGLMIREYETETTNEFYAFALDASGEWYTFWLYTNDEWISLIDWTEIDVDLSEWTQMTVQAVGSHFSLFINGSLIDEVDDGTIASGVNGMLVGVHESDKKIKVQYDDYVVRVADNVPDELLVKAPPASTEEALAEEEAVFGGTRAWSLPLYPDAVYMISDQDGDAEWDAIVNKHARNLAIEPPYYYEFFELPTVRRYDEVRTFYIEKLQALGYKLGADLQGDAEIYVMTFVNTSASPQKKVIIQFWRADSIVLIIYKNP